MHGFIWDEQGVALKEWKNGYVYEGDYMSNKAITYTTKYMLAKRGITNKVMFNDLPFDEKTRESSGEHKANCIKALFSAGYVVTAHFEDDDVQANVIRKECPDVPVIMIVHDLTEKENKRNYDF